MIVLLRRRTEFGLILLGVLIVVGAYTLTSLGRTSSVPVNIGPFLLVVLLLLLIAHIATRFLAQRADSVLLPLAALLNGLGYVFIARIDEAQQPPNGLAGLQATWTGVGIAAYVATLFFIRRARDLQRYRYTVMLAGIVLLLLPLAPGLGQEIRGARIWVAVGPINFQPGEFAKIVLAVFFAGYLVERRELLGMATWPRFGPVLPDPRHLGPLLLAWGFSLVIMIAERDLGSSLLFFALFMLMLWIATERSVYLAVGAALFGAGAWFAWSTFAHVQQRVEIWLNPWHDFDGSGYQVIQSWFAMAWGGLVGTGPGLGNPDRIPAVTTDFIFSAIAEELGLLGATGLIVAFLLMVGAGLRIAIRTHAPFEKLLAAGLTLLLGVQAFIIMAGVTRLLPLTGITLPFVSYGGSSLVANYVLLALLVRISDTTTARFEQMA